MKRQHFGDVQPPDFRLQLYQPKPKKRNAKESMIPNYDEDDWRKKQASKRKDNIKFERIPLPKILQETPSKLGSFVTTFDIPDSYAANLMLVKIGKFHPGPYTNPGPHVFRPDDLAELIKKYGVPDFETSYTRDPQGLIAKSKGLRVLCESYKDLDSLKTDGYRKQMITYRPTCTDPHWDGRLIIPTGAYRKGHSDALMKRIEKQLPWCPHRDKLEPIIRPDIHDHKTVDWLAVTGHPMDESTRL
ncbi:hypothetical protein QZH41_002512 [Actinostola sp. cb2023]|nr:hypothetical protein QZH41_002512 [Actinostola sp. cb2023]